MDDVKQPIAAKASAVSGRLAERRQIFSLPSEDALKAIIDSPHAAELVQSFPEEDLHLLVHEIGIEDALPLLAMASDEQWTYMLDMELWQEDRIDMVSFSRWVDYLIHADLDRLTGRFFDQHLEDMELFLYRNLEVVIREHDEDPSAFGEDFVTLDDHFYFRILDSASEEASEGVTETKRKEAVLRFLQHLADRDHTRYQRIMLESIHTIPAETEEEMYRLRNVRLAEKGFLPFDEAIGIYQPLRSDDIEQMSRKAGTGRSEKDIPASIPFPLKEKTETGSLFADALRRITDESVWLDLQAELAGLGNRVIAADRLRIRDRTQLDEVIQKASGYIGIGLELLIRQTGVDLLDQAAGILENLSLPDLFRVGYGEALELKWKAKRWQPESWPARNGFPLSFWGERWLGLLGGLLLDKPLCYDHDDAGWRYRDFGSLDDIHESEKGLEAAIAVDRLLHRLSPKLPAALPKGTITYKALVLTVWARHCLNLPAVLSPIDLDDFEPFYRSLWSGKKTGNVVKSTIREAFSMWLRDVGGRVENDIPGALADVSRGLLKDVEEEYGAVSVEDLKPKYSRLFLLVA